ncbi:hypothetical protein ABEB36_013563 [Hypothenemus hampei]|uniref:Uncharacterized protein n=1 Tax=Hypothenemus hampei TaxID=57062 RepID=A0ABD1E4X3_HYPHA
MSATMHEIQSKYTLSGHPVQEFERYVQLVLLNIIRENPLIKINDIEEKFYILTKDLLHNFQDMGLGTIEYVLLRTPYVYKDEHGQYYIWAIGPQVVILAGCHDGQS